MKQLEAMQRQGASPPALANRPIETGMHLYLIGFAELTTCRQIGMGVGPIPWTAIQKYIEVEGLKGDEAYEFNEVIRHMDGVWLDLNRKTAEKAQAAAKSAGRSARGAG